MRTIRDGHIPDETYEATLACDACGMAASVERGDDFRISRFRDILQDIVYADMALDGRPVGPPRHEYLSIVARCPTCGGQLIGKVDLGVMAETSGVPA